MARRVLSGIETARTLGMHPTVISNLITGRRLPGRENAIKIERATGIPVEAWTPTRVGKSDKALRPIGRKPMMGKEKAVHG